MAYIKRLKPRWSSQKIKDTKDPIYTHSKMTLYPNVLSRKQVKRNWTTITMNMLKSTGIKIKNVRETYASLSHHFTYEKYKTGRYCWVFVEEGGVVFPKLFRKKKNRVNYEPPRIVEFEEMLEEDMKLKGKRIGGKR